MKVKDILLVIVILIFAIGLFLWIYTSERIDNSTAIIRTSEPTVTPTPRNIVDIKVEALDHKTVLRAKEGYKFIKIKISLKNLLEKTVKFDEYDFVLQDDTTQSKLKMIDVQTIDYGEILPKKTIEGYLTFQIKKESKEIILINEDLNVKTKLVFKDGKYIEAH